MEIREIYLKRLMKLRKKNNLALQALGEIIGGSNQSVSRLERGKNVPSFDTLIALADFFKVSLDYLVGRTDVPEVK